MSVDSTSAPVSLIVCTRFRAAGLERLLRSVAAAADRAGALREVIVVDNGPSTDTASVVEALACALPLRCIVEPVTGLSRARNAGYAAVRGDLVVFVDDDETLTDGFFTAYVEGMQEHSEAALFGGRMIPEYPRPPSAWYLSEVVPRWPGIAGQYDLGPRPRSYRLDMPMPCGGNFALRRARVPGNAPFRVDLGLQGSRVIVGEETDLIGRLLKNGEEGHYLPDAIVKHITPAERLTTAYVFRWLVGYWKTVDLMDRSADGSLALGARLRNLAIDIVFCSRERRRRGRVGIEGLERLARSWARLTAARRDVLSRES